MIAIMTNPPLLQLYPILCAIRKVSEILRIRPLRERSYAPRLIALSLRPTAYGSLDIKNAAMKQTIIPDDQEGPQAQEWSSEQYDARHEGIRYGKVYHAHRAGGRDDPYHYIVIGGNVDVLYVDLQLAGLGAEEGVAVVQFHIIAERRAF